MKYFLVFALSCLSLVHDVKPMATDPPSDFFTLKPAVNPETGKDTPSSSSKWSKDGFRVSKNAHKFMATIRETPSELYLCSATFIANDALLTTARCLIGRDTEKLFVHSNSASLETEGLENLAIKSVHLHPDFDMNPVTMDFGIIILEKPVDYITPLSLPSRKLGRSGHIGTGHTWRFTNNTEKFLVHEYHAEIISNEKCFLIEHEIIPDHKACAEGPLLVGGYFDQGMPFTMHRKGKNYMYGINHVSNLGDKVKKLWRVAEVVPWITDTLKANSNEVIVPTTQKPTTPTPAPANNDNEFDEEFDDIDEDDGEGDDNM